MNTIKSISLISLLSLIVMVIFVCADSHVDAAKQLYEYDQWVGITKTNYTHTLTTFVPDFFGSGYSTNHPPIVDDVEGGGLSYIYTINNILNNEIYNIRIDLRNDVVSTHSFLMWLFAYSSAWQPFPLGETKSVYLGDRCYIGHPTNFTKNITFVRNNIYVRLSSNNSTNSVLPFATWLDNKILEMSFDE